MVKVQLKLKNVSVSRKKDHLFSLKQYYNVVEISKIPDLPTWQK